MSQPPANIPPEAGTARASIARRLWGCFLSICGIGLGAAAIFAMPENCRILGYITGGVFVPIGIWLLFISLRGRKSDLQSLTGRDALDTTVSAAASEVIGEVVDKLL